MKDFSKVLDPALKLWQIGLTKVFMKETIKGVLETSMGLAIYNEVKNIQRLFRGFRDRKFVKKLRSSTKFIKLYILKYVRRKRFRNVVMKQIKILRQIISKIKKFYRWRLR